MPTTRARRGSRVGRCPIPSSFCRRVAEIAQASVRCVPTTRAPTYTSRSRFASTRGPAPTCGRGSSTTPTRARRRRWCSRASRSGRRSADGVPFRVLRDERASATRLSTPRARFTDLVAAPGVGERAVRLPERQPAADVGGERREPARQEADHAGTFRLPLVRLAAALRARRRRRQVVRPARRPRRTGAQPEKSAATRRGSARAASPMAASPPPRRPFGHRRRPRRP